MRLPRDVSGAELAKRPNRLGYRITRRLNAGQIRDARRRIALTDFQNDGVLMKNRQYELRRRLARQYHRNTRGDSFEQDILLRHDYGEVDPNGLSWWDDVMFVLGKVRINVAWRHPRQGYHDLIVDAAMEATRHLQEKIEGDMFDGAEKSFKKLGRSRKKVMSYTLTDRSGAREWFDALRAEEARLGAEADFAVSPSVKIEMLDWCRYVDIVAPLEVRHAAELRALASLVRRLLKGETTLAQEFPGYSYGRAQWLADGLAGQPLLPVSHRIAGT